MLVSSLDDSRQNETRQSFRIGIKKAFHFSSLNEVSGETLPHCTVFSFFKLSTKYKHLETVPYSRGQQWENGVARRLLLLSSLI